MEKHEDSVRAISESSHELGNYTYFAPHPNSLLKADLKRELEKAHKYIERVSGQALRSLGLLTASTATKLSKSRENLATKQ